ncbi:MMPL family transporter [Fontimonas sp. SYSU GA230001]|uniref:efflux RND transporter permease subunit n=1 Tax=Fontimonas sp. SYSU GA230001 TaxID=3142450 RepID=UPI0032B47772
MEATLAALLVRYRNALFVLACLAVLALVAGARDLWFEGSYRIFFSDDDPYLVAHDEIENSYTKADNVAFIVAPRDGRIFTRRTLQALRELTEAAWTMPRSIRVDSITNFQHSVAQGDELIVNDLVPDPASLSDADIAALEKTALAEPALVGGLLSKRAHVSSVNVRLEMPGDSREATAANQEVMQAARRLRSEFRTRYPELDIHLMGQVVVNHAFNEIAEADAAALVPLMFVVVIVLVGVFLRSPGSVLTTSVVILFSILGTVGVLGWLGYQVNQINVSAPVIILTLAVSDCVHLLVHYLNDLRRGMPKVEAMRHTLEINIVPVFLTSFTTAIGFFSLNTSDSPPFRELGTVVGFGVFGAMLFTLTMLPAMMLWLPVRAGRETRLQQFTLAGLADRILRHHQAWFLGATAVALLLMAFMPRNQLNDDTVEYFDTSLEIRQAFDFVQDNLTGVDSITYSLNAEGPSGINEPAYLKAVDAFKTWLESQPEVTHVSSFVDVVKRLNRNMHGGDPAHYTIPDDRELIAQYVLLYELSLPQGLDLNDSINFDKSATRLSVSISNVASRELIEFERRAADWLERNVPQFRTHGSSLSVMFAHIGQNNIYSMLRGSMIALVLIALTLIAALRSVKFGLMSLLPNAFPAAIAFGVWGIVDGKVNLAAAGVFSITLGIVVDNTIHFFSKYLYARRTRGQSTEDAIRYAFSTVGAALLVTTAALTMGFMILARSDFNVNATMGQMTAMVIGIALVFDLLFLPGFLMRFDRRAAASEHPRTETPPRAAS